MIVPALAMLVYVGHAMVAPAATVVAQSDVVRAKEAYARAVQLESEGNHSAALSLLWEAAALAPQDADVQNRLGEALERIGVLEAAMDAYRRALAARPAFRKAANNLILALVKAGKGPEAVERARALVADAPDDADRHFTLGLALSEQDVGDAITSFRRALELAPRDTLARYNLALVLRRADRLPEALAELEKALAIESRPEVHYTLGVIYWHQGDLPGAVGALRNAVKEEPGYAEAHYTLGAVLKAQREWKESAASLRRAIALRPNLSAAHYTLAQVLQLGGDSEGARTQLAEAERLRRRGELEHEALVWTSVGIQKIQAGDLHGALDQFRRAIRTYEEYAPAHYQMGLVLRRLGEHESARAAFARAQRLNSSLLPPRNMP